MKKTDLLILCGLILSLVAFLTFSLQNVSNQSTLIISNQQLINETLNTIVGLANDTASDRELLIQHAQYSREAQNAIINKIINNTDSNVNMTIQNREMITFLRSQFNETYLDAAYRQYIQSNTTQEKLATIINLLNKTE